MMNYGNIVKSENNLPATDQVLAKFEAFVKYAHLVYNSAAKPEWCKSEGDLVICLMSGYEMGIAMSMSMKYIYVIKGRIAVESEALRALILRREPNATFKIVTYSPEKSVVLAGMPGKELMEFTYTMEQARRMPNFDTKFAYKSDPALMLLNRNTARIKSIVFPHVCFLPTDAEVEEMAEAKAAVEMETDTEPEILETTAEIIEESEPAPKTTKKSGNSEPKLSEAQATLQKNIIGYLMREYGSEDSEFKTRKREYPGLLKIITNGKCDPGSLLGLKLNQLTDKDCEEAIENLNTINSNK